MRIKRTEVEPARAISVWQSLRGGPHLRALPRGVLALPGTHEGPVVLARTARR